MTLKEFKILQLRLTITFQDIKAKTRL